MRFPSLRAALATACALTSSSVSLTCDAADENNGVKVNPVVVTATRTAETADETVAPVTVIDRQEIEGSGAKTLPDLLGGRPGVDLSSNGGFGKATTVNLRGLGSGKVLFLINGSRIADPSSIESAPAIQHIPTAQIERVEIVRGPRASLYGSQALGGVINIITRQPEEQRVEGSVGYGSYASQRASASVSGRSEALGYNLSLSGFDTHGYDIRDDRFDDDDGYENASLSGRFDYAPTQRLKINLDVLTAQGRTEFDNCSDASSRPTSPSFGDCHTDFFQATVGLGASLQVTDRWDSSIRVSRHRQERRNFFDGDNFNNEFDGTTSRITWQNDIQLGQSNLVTAGLEGTREQIDRAGGSTFSQQQRDRSALFGQWQTHAGVHDVVWGLRTIDDEQFGHETVGNIDYGVQLVERLRLVASAGTAFKAPSLFQLYSDSFGNTDLRPEESQTLELGMVGQAENGRIEIRAYRTEVEQLIEFDFSQGYQNVSDEVEIDGLEFTVDTTLGGWATRLSYTWSRPVNEGTGEVLPNRAQRSFRLGLDRSFGRLRTGGEIEAQSDRSGGQFTDPVGGYGILNLHVSYRIASAWRVRATVDNATDNEYRTSSGFFAPGRTTFVELTYRPGQGR